MSKFVIILCVVFFASAANASIDPAVIQIIQENEHLINVTIINIKEKFRAIREKGESVSAVIWSKTYEFNNNFVDDVIINLTIADSPVNDLIYHHPDVNTTECNKLSRYINEISSAVIDETQICTNREMNYKLNYIDSISEVFNNALANLTEIRKMGQNYTCNTDTPDSTKMMSYVEIAINPAKVFDEVSQRSTTWNAQLDSWLTTIQSSLDICRETNGFPDFVKGLFSVAEDTKKCVEKKIDEAARTTNPE